MTLATIINSIFGKQEKQVGIHQDIIDMWIDAAYDEMNTIDGEKFDFVFHTDSDYFSVIQSDLDAIFEQRQLMAEFESLVN